MSETTTTTTEAPMNTTHRTVVDEIIDNFIDEDYDLLDTFDTSAGFSILVNMDGIGHVTFSRYGKGDDQYVSIERDADDPASITQHLGLLTAIAEFYGEDDDTDDED